MKPYVKPALQDYILRYHKSPPSEFLKHYGVKGMKWGVRRSKEELRHNPSSIIASVNRRSIQLTTVSGIHIAKMSSHAGDQANKRKVSSEEIIDALKNPLYIKPIKYDSFNRLSNQFVGKSATVCINPDDGTISSLWRTGKKVRNKYLKGIDK